MSRYITDGNSYRKRVLFPIIGIIVFLMLCAVVPATVIASKGGIKAVPLQWMTAILMILLAAGCAVLLHRIGKTAYRDALVFCVDDNEALYVVDARYCAPANKGFWGSRVYFICKFFRVIAETGKMLERIKEDGIPEDDMPTGRIRTYAAQITGIHQLRDVPAGKFVICKIAGNHGAKGTRSYDVSNHHEELFEVLKQRSVSKKWETDIHPYTKQIWISALLTAVCLGLCAASYPTVGLLPEAVYFPCLFALYIPVIALGIFVLKRRRGE